MKRQWVFILGIVIILLIAILAVLNVDAVPVNFGFTRIELPLILLMIAMVLIGAFIVAIFSTVKNFQDKKTINQLKAEKHQIEREYQAQIEKLKQDNQMETQQNSQQMIREDQ